MQANQLVCGSIWTNSNTAGSNSKKGQLTFLSMVNPI